MDPKNKYILNFLSIINFFNWNKIRFKKLIEIVYVFIEIEYKYLLILIKNQLIFKILINFLIIKLKIIRNGK